MLQKIQFKAAKGHGQRQKMIFITRVGWSHGFSPWFHVGPHPSSHQSPSHRQGCNIISREMQDDLWNLSHLRVAWLIWLIGDWFDLQGWVVVLARFIKPPNFKPWWNTNIIPRYTIQWEQICNLDLDRVGYLVTWLAVWLDFSGTRLVTWLVDSLNFGNVIAIGDSPSQRSIPTFPRRRFNTSVAFQGLSCTALRGSQTSSLTAGFSHEPEAMNRGILRWFLQNVSSLGWSPPRWSIFWSTFIFKQQKIGSMFSNEYTLVYSSYDSWKIFLEEKNAGLRTNPWINKRIEWKKTSAATVPNEVELFHTCVVAPDLPDPPRDGFCCWKISWAPWDTNSVLFWCSSRSCSLSWWRFFFGKTFREFVKIS